VRPVVVLIFHATAPEGAGPLTRALAETRHSLACAQREAWLAAGVDQAEVVARPPDGRAFGERLAAKIRARSRSASAAGEGAGGGGAIVMGSGSIPLARPADMRRFVDVAAGPPGFALANNRFSADVVAVSRAADLADLPPLPADNALPRWLEEKAGVAVSDLRDVWKLGLDLDSPLDLLLIDNHGTGPLAQGRPAAPLVRTRMAQLHAVLGDRRAELLVAGRVSVSTLRWLQDGVACRVRALVEERGLRAATVLAQSGATSGDRPPRSVLGRLLDHEGPESLARIVSEMADAALIDTRVLLAHRHGAVESAWPPAEDRFASDLLLPISISDPWLRTLTVSASTRFPVPILLGGHTLVNGGLRLLAQRARTTAR
jgi:hypothetical protein